MTSTVRQLFDGMRRCPQCGAASPYVIARSYRGATLASDSGPDFQCYTCGHTWATTPRVQLPQDSVTGSVLSELRDEGRHD